MPWGTFWGQFLISTIAGGALTTIVGLVVGFFIKRWFKQLRGEQERTTAAAGAAATNAKDAAKQSRAAVEHAVLASEDARTAGDNSKQSGEALVWLAQQLAARDVAVDELKERVDRLLGTRARELATERPTQFLVPFDVGDDTDAATATGRHRLHTSMIPTGQVHIPEPDPDDMESW